MHNGPHHHASIHPSPHWSEREPHAAERQGKNKYARQVAHCFHRQTFNSFVAPLLFLWAGPTDNGNTPTTLSGQSEKEKWARERDESETHADDERQGAEVHCGTSDMGFKNLYLFNCRSLWHKKEVYFTHFSVLDRADKRVCCLRSNEKKSLHALARSLARSTRPPTAYTRAARQAKNSFLPRRMEWSKPCRGSLFKYSHIAPVFLW
jgi:hypothetical protein